MFYSAHDAYLESRILSADPLQLIRLLYQAALDAVQDARHCLAEGKIAERSRSISRACEILIELHSSLDHRQGGEIAGRLAALYEYMQRKLLEANFQQSDPPLGEVLALLSTLADGWAGVGRAVDPQVSAGNPWPQQMTPEPAAAGTSRGWSL